MRDAAQFQVNNSTKLYQMPKQEGYHHMLKGHRNKLFPPQVCYKLYKCVRRNK